MRRFAAMSKLYNAIAKEMHTEEVTIVVLLKDSINHSKISLFFYVQKV